MRNLKIKDSTLVCGFHILKEDGEYRNINGFDDLLGSLYANKAKQLKPNSRTPAYEFAASLDEIIVTVEEIIITEKHIYEVPYHDRLGVTDVESGYCGVFADEEIDFCYLTYKYPLVMTPDGYRTHRWQIRGDTQQTPLMSLLKEKNLPYTFYDFEMLYGYLTNTLTQDLIVSFRKEMSELLMRMGDLLRVKYPDWRIRYLSDSVEVRK